MCGSGSRLSPRDWVRKNMQQQGDHGKPNSLAAGRATQLAAASLIAEMDEWAAAYPGMYSLKTVQNLIAANVGASRLPFLPTSEEAAKDMKKRLMGWCAGLSAVAAKPGWCNKLLH